ncbi:MAG TPA: serine/threonine-protein kinase [Candidatus Sericytochromatia bacterium]
MRDYALSISPFPIFFQVSYCLNPDCPKPHNPDNNKFCQGCGFNLQLLERYRAISLIGQGGFGRTFLAVDEGRTPSVLCVFKQLWTRNQTPEALTKTMPQTVCKATIALFQQEALRLEQLGNHPQIPALLAHFEQDQYLYLVQEFIDGVNLARVVEEEGTFSEAQIWRFLDDFLPVLKFIHDHQVIHRDIKPENIIRCTPGYRRREGGEGGEVFTSSSQDNSSPTSPASPAQFVLVDFGAAKLVTGKALHTGTRIGSPEYVAPEQVKGKAVFASDLYSLGVTCIYLLTGIPPFDLFDVVNDCWAWQDYLTQDVSAELAQILDKLLVNALTRRFQSVDEVVQAMNQVRSDKIFTPDADKGNPNELRTPIKEAPRDSGHLQKESLPTQRWQCLHTLVGKSAINSVAISPDGSLLASGSDNKTIRLWDLKTGVAIATLTGHSQGVKSVAFSPDGTILGTGSDDRTIKLWNLSDRKEICTLSGHSHAVKSVAFSPNGQILASGSWDKTIKLWDVRTGLQISSLTGHRLQVASVAFSACSKFLASASFDRTVRLWELSSGLSSTFEGHAWAVFTVAFSPDGKIATGSDDRTIILWDLNTGKPVYTLLGHSWSVVEVAFSPDGETLISGSWDKTIKLWRVSTGQEIATLTGHLDSVCAVAMSPSGQIIASSSKDKTINIWHRLE